MEVVHVKEYNRLILNGSRTTAKVYTTAKGLKKTGWVVMARIKRDVVSATYYKTKQEALDCVAILDRIPF